MERYGDMTDYTSKSVNYYTQYGPKGKGTYKYTFKTKKTKRVKYW